MCLADSVHLWMPAPPSVPSTANLLIGKDQKVNEWLLWKFCNTDNEVETAQWLAALAALAKDLGLVPSTHLVAHNWL